MVADALHAVVEGLLEEHGKEDPKECRCEDAILLHAAAHREGGGCSTSEAGCVVHTLMEGCEHLSSLGGISYLLQEAA